MTKPKHAAASNSLAELDKQIAALEELKKKRLAERQLVLGTMISDRVILDLSDRQWAGALNHIKAAITQDPEIVRQWEGRPGQGGAGGRAGSV